MAEKNITEKTDEVIVPDVIAHAEMKADTIKEDENGDLFIEGFSSTKGIDEGDDLVEPTAFLDSKDRFMKNPVVLAFHGWGPQGREPIGRVVEAEIKSRGFWVKALISKSEEKLRQKIKEGIIKAFSIGFRIKESEMIKKAGKEIRRITKLDLMEISVVGIGMNREALFNVAKAFRTNADLTHKLEDIKNKYSQLSVEIKDIRSLMEKKESINKKDEDVEMKEGDVNSNAKEDQETNETKAGRTISSKTKGIIQRALSANGLVSTALNDVLNVTEEAKPHTDEGRDKKPKKKPTKEQDFELDTTMVKNLTESIMKGVAIFASALPNNK